MEKWGNRRAAEAQSLIEEAQNCSDDELRAKVDQYKEELSAARSESQNWSAAHPELSQDVVRETSEGSEITERVNDAYMKHTIFKEELQSRTA